MVSINTLKLEEGTPYERSAKKLKQAKLRKVRMQKYSANVKKYILDEKKRKKQIKKTEKEIKNNLMKKRNALKNLNAQQKKENCTVNKQLKQNSYIQPLRKPFLKKRQEIPKLNISKISREPYQVTEILKNITARNSSRLDKLNDLNKEHRSLNRNYSKTNLCNRTKIKKKYDDQILIHCKLCNWKSTMPQNWTSRIIDKCENCKAFLYCSQVREYRYEANQLLNCNEKIENLEKENEEKMQEEILKNEEKFIFKIDWPGHYFRKKQLMKTEI